MNKNKTLTVDYKKFYLRCQQCYPFVTEELAPASDLTDLKQLPGIFEKFLSLTGFSREDIFLNRNDSRLYFIAITVKLSDPLFFSFDYYAPYRLLFSIRRLSGCSKGKILYNLKKVKNYWKVYPEFRNQVNQLYSQIKLNEIIGNKAEREESKNNKGREIQETR